MRLQLIADRLMIVINKYVDPKIYYLHKDFSVNFYLLEYVKFFLFFFFFFDTK